MAGVEVTSENYTKIVELSNGAIKQGTVEYKPDKKSLVLRNVIIDRAYECLENVSCDGLMVTIYGKGNTFTSNGIAVKCQTNTTIQVPLQASATFRSKNAARVVYLIGGNLTIKGKGDLLVIGEKENGIEGKNATETLNIEDIQMTVEANGCSLYDLGEVVFSGTATTKLTFYGNSTSKRVLNVKKMTFNGDQNLSLPTDAYFDSQRQTVIAGPTITYSIPFTADDRENSIEANTGTPVTRKSVVINTDRVADVNETNFPNATFRAKVKKLCQYNENILTPFDVYCTRLIYFYQGVGISTNGVVKGLEHFIYLRQLHINRDALQSIDLSKNPELRDLAIEQCSKLTTLDLSTNTELTKLSCYDNELTTLDLSKNTKLIKLRCYGNQIKGDKMQVLVESLPTVGSGEFVVIDTKKTNEGNVITKAQVNIAKSKGWKVLDYNGMKEYAGSDIEIYNITASASPTAGGTVSGGGTKEHGSSVTLTATPNTGYKFVRWTEDGSQVSTNATYTFTADKNRTLVAVFEEEGTPDVAVTGVSLSPTTKELKESEKFTLVAQITPSNATNQNVTWISSDATVATVSNGEVTAEGVGTATITVTTVDGNKTATCEVTVTAAAATTYALTVVPPTNGTLTANPSGNVAEGTEVTLTATPASGYKLKSLKAYKTGEPSTTVAINGNKFNMPGYPVTVEAEFEEEASSETYYFLTLVSPTDGTLTASPSGNVAEGTEVTLTATPASGYKLKALKAYKTGEPSTVVDITGNKFNMPDYGVTVEAEFEEETTIETNYPLTVVSPTNGTLTASPSGNVAEGTEVTLTATPASGYKLKALKAYKTGEPSTVVDITGNKFNMPDYGVTVEAEFEEEASAETYYLLTVVSPTNGTLTASPSGNISEGTEVTLTATPAEGYKLKALKAYKTGEPSTTVAINGNKFNMPAYEVTVEAEFEKTSSGGGTTYYTLSYIASTGGSIKGASVQTVKQGESGTAVEAIAADGYRFVKWSDGITTAKRTDTNVQANVSVQAEFEKRDGATGIFDTKLDALSAYPNPTTGELWVSVAELAEATAAEVLLYNTNGQLLQRVPTRAASAGSAASRISIDLSRYPSGLYIVRVGNAVAKVVKQ